MDCRIIATTIALGSAVVILLAPALERNNLEMRAMNKIKQINKPYNVATDDEWLKVSQLLGKKYTLNSTKKLSIRDLNKIVNYNF